MSRSWTIGVLFFESLSGVLALSKPEVSAATAVLVITVTAVSAMPHACRLADRLLAGDGSAA